MTARAARALHASVRRPVAQDAALAAGLLLVCLLVGGPLALLGARPGQSVDNAGEGPDALGVWWAATALTVVGVTSRRRWPLPMLVLCTLCAAARLAAGTLPTVMDLAVLILLYTVAARYSRAVSLSALGALLMLSVAWVMSASLAGRPVPMLAAQYQVCNRDAASGGPDRAATAGVDCRGGGSREWSGLPTLGSSLTAAWAIGSGTRNRRAYLEQLHARAQTLERERDQQAALAVATERERISREVHDVVAHGLSLIIVQAQGAEAALDNRPADTRGALQTIISTGRESLADMRRVVAALGDVEDRWHPQPGLAALPGLVDRVRAAGTPVELRIDGIRRALPAAVDLSAYRIVQEALTNVMKHAAAGATARLVVSFGDSEIHISVSDDGRGTAEAGGGGHHDDGNGLRGMRRRVELLGGHLTAAPDVHGGFVVRAAIPLQGQDL